MVICEEQSTGHRWIHYVDVIIDAMAFQITSLTIVYSTQETPKLRVIGLCEGNSPVTGEFPAQMTSSAVNVSIWWRHHVLSQRDKSASQILVFS